MKRLLILCACFAVATAVAAQDSLSAAKDLYASAAYEEALSTLTRLHDSSTAAAPIADEIDQYRAFCLFALGRTAEARSVAEALIAKDPLLQLDGDASPRIAAMFAEARKRLLPGLTRDQYTAARASIDRKDFAAAVPQLARTRRMLEEAQTIGASDGTLGDLRVLVDGFIDLTRATAEAQPIVPQSQPQVAPSPSGAPTNLTSQPDVPIAPKKLPPVYDATAAEVVAPVALYQQMPTLPPGLTDVLSRTHKSGVLDLLIDEQGSVERAVMREPVNPMFDGLVLAAARSWKYRPAMKDGLAVRYLKKIMIVN